LNMAGEVPVRLLFVVVVIAVHACLAIAEENTTVENTTAEENATVENTTAEENTTVVFGGELGKYNCSDVPDEKEAWETCLHDHDTPLCGDLVSAWRNCTEWTCISTVCDDGFRDLLEIAHKGRPEDAECLELCTQAPTTPAPTTPAPPSGARASKAVGVASALAALVALLSLSP